MKTKTIPFDLETAKKIQAGEIEGSIKTKNGNKARILCTDLESIEYSIAAAIIVNAPSGAYEALETYTRNGFFTADEREHWNNLVLEVPDNVPQFKPFDRVLVRDNDEQSWKCALFSHEAKDGYCASAFWWSQCIPYEGNEHLVGTTNKPKED